MRSPINRRKFLGTLAAAGAAWTLPGCVVAPSSPRAQGGRPNLLWIIAEDMGPWLGCYGEPLVQTPHLDALAARGVRFTRACSNAPVCSAARASLFTGLHACSVGADTHRQPRAVPAHFFFPQYLRAAGYWCGNRAKEDYNTSASAAMWDASDPNAHYRQRASGQPFFHVNSSLAQTHMARVATLTTGGRTPRRIDPAGVALPSWLPDLPELRDDRAWHLDAAGQMDAEVGRILAELDASGEAPNTIIFFFSDHGGCWPGGKGFLHEAGLRIPLLISAPPRWAHLLPATLGGVCADPVSFVDLAATVFAFTGVPPPTHLQGIPVGATRRSPVLGFRGQQVERWDPSRSLCDGRFKYLRHFTPHRAPGLRQNYHWRMPGQQAWERAYREGRCDERQSRFWQPKPREELYDLRADPEETHNLAGDPAQAERLTAFRRELAGKMRAIRDLGLFPETLRDPGDHGSFHGRLAAEPALNEAVISAAEVASEVDPARAPALVKLTNNPAPILRYWGATGLLALSHAGCLGAEVAALGALLRDPEAEVQLVAAETFVRADCATEAAFAVLLAGFRSRDKYLSAAAATAIETLGTRAAPLIPAIAEDFAAGRNDFLTRSVLITLGHLPYDRLYAGPADF